MRNKTMRITLAFFGWVLEATLVSAIAYAQNSQAGECSKLPSVHEETTFRARLLSPISTETSHRGDKITAQVIGPDLYRSCYMEGQIRESKGGKSKSVL